VRNSVFWLVLGVGPLAGTLIAHAQTPRPTLVAQAPVTVPPSGVLVTQPPAPVAVPPSGVLVTRPTAEGPTAPTIMRHVVHRRPAARRVTTRTLARKDVARRVTTTLTATVRESIEATPAVATTAAAAPTYIAPRIIGKGPGNGLPWLIEGH
jgi:hypothetical protein